MFRSAVTRGALQLTKSSKNVPFKFTQAAFASRNFSTILEGREVAEDTRYIRNLEAQKKAEMRANIERILALEEGHEEKKVLTELLGMFDLCVFFYWNIIVNMISLIMLAWMLTK